MDAESPRPVCVDGSDRSVAGSCAFSPDGGTLYYLADFGERTDVCAARRADPSRTWGENGSFRLERLSKDDSGKSLLSVSPDGSKLAWTGKTGEFRIADTNGCVVSSPKTPTQGCAEYVWSPDTSRTGCSTFFARRSIPARASEATRATRISCPTAGGRRSRIFPWWCFAGTSLPRTPRYSPMRSRSSSNAATSATIPNSSKSGLQERRLGISIFGTNWKRQFLSSRLCDWPQGICRRSSYGRLGV